jgi:hypothetical protein
MPDELLTRLHSISCLFLECCKMEFRGPIAAESGVQNAMQPDWIPSNTFDTDRQRLRTYLLDLLSDRSVMQKGFDLSKQVEKPEANA